MIRDINIINDHVRYVGVNDRVSNLFESMWPLPQGVSYNSYLVTGSEKTALIDGVEITFAPEQMEKIRQALGDRRPDYLVINHMEPDHSGAIDLLRAEWPELCIVGNRQTLAMVEGFYGQAVPPLEVKDGDSLSLGGDCTLRFYLTPMVHWPETMMTLLEEERTLFSGDAFGCFGALDGMVVDADADCSRYMPEMVRYYSNIVGKYGMFVQRAFAKLKDADFGTICPTHGPVWRDRLEEVVSLYDRMSRYEPLDEGAVVYYGSMYGHTQRVAEEMARVLVASGVAPVEVMNVARQPLSDQIAAAFRHRRLLFCAPTYSGSLFPPMRQLLEALTQRGLKDRLTGVAGGFTWAGVAGKEMTALLTEACMAPLDAALEYKQNPDAAALAAARNLATAIASADK